MEGEIMGLKYGLKPIDFSNDPQYFLTFIIAIKNDAKLLSSTVESIVYQANDINSKINIMVLDCISIDSPFLVLEKFSNNVCIDYFNEYDDGIYSAWNKGLKLINSKWVTFFGAGDILTPNALVVMEKFASNHNDLSVISSKSLVTYSNGSKRVMGKMYIVDEFKKKFTTNHAGLLYSSDIFLKYGNFNESYKTAADYEFLLRIGPLVKFGFINFVTSIYPYGGISSNSISPLFEAFRLRKKYSNLYYIHNLTILFYGFFAHFRSKYFR